MRSRGRGLLHGKLYYRSTVGILYMILASVERVIFTKQFNFYWVKAGAHSCRHGDGTSGGILCCLALWTLWIAGWGLHGSRLLHWIPQMLDQIMIWGYLNDGSTPWALCHIPWDFTEQFCGIVGCVALLGKGQRYLGVVCIVVLYCVTDINSNVQS